MSWLMPPTSTIPVTGRAGSDQNQEPRTQTGHGERWDWKQARQTLAPCQQVRTKQNRECSFSGAARHTSVFSVSGLGPELLLFHLPPCLQQQ